MRNTKFNDFISYVKQKINFKLLLIILLFQFFPTIYKTTRIFFLGTLPDENSYNIASNILWLSVLYEIITESIVVPLFFVSNYDFSLRLSINGVGISSILVNSICASYFVIYLAFQKKWTFYLLNNSFNSTVLKRYFKLFIISSIEVTVRNVCFYLMVIKPINDLNNQGIYWIANNFIWTWLLMPVISISILIKESFIRNTTNKEFLYQLYFYILIMIFIVVVWIALFPIHKYFIKYVLNVENYNEVSNLVYILIPFYIFFAFGQMVDSIFINSGKISFYLFQSLFVNLTVYPIFFILWKVGIWKPTLENICIMFGLGMLVHFIINIPLFLIYLKKVQRFHIRLFKNKINPF